MTTASSRSPGDAASTERTASRSRSTTRQRPRRLSIANAVIAANEVKVQTKRRARIVALLAKLTVVKSGGMQLLNHVVMFSVVIWLLHYTFAVQPRTATLHASTKLNTLRPLMTPSERDGSFAVIGAFAELVEQSRTAPDEHAFVVVSPILLRHYPRAGGSYHGVPGLTCAQDESMRVNFERLRWEGLRQVYEPAAGELLELGTYDEATASLGAFNASDARAVLANLTDALWLTPRVSRALIMDVTLLYGEDTYVAARAAFEVDGVAGIQSMVVRTWSIIAYAASDCS